LPVKVYSIPNGCKEDEKESGEKVDLEEMYKDKDINVKVLDVCELQEFLDVHELENIIKDLQAQKLEDVKEMHAMEIELMEKTARLSSKEDESRCYCQIELDKSLHLTHDEPQNGLYKKRQVWTSFIYTVLMTLILALTLALTLAIAVRMELMRDDETYKTDKEDNTYETVCLSILRMRPYCLSLLSTVTGVLSRLPKLSKLTRL